jgi:pimeloyl-ACP methyl ester carboxylesterase
MPFVKVSSNLKMHYIVPSSPDPNKPYIDPTRPTIVMLHPRFFDSHFFAPQFRDGRLTKAYNVIAIDHHYHGRTVAPLDSKPYDFDLVSYAGPFHEARYLI